MIPTNQLQITFDHEAIANDFVILEAKRDSGDYRNSLVPDLALQVGCALAVVYTYGDCCYILYDRKKADRNRLKAALEGEADDIRLREVPSTAFVPKHAYLLAQLLCNALPALGADGKMYHNLTGKLYRWDSSWRRGRREVPYCLWALRIQLTWDNCVKLSVVTFRPADRKKIKRGEAQYLFDKQSGCLRRLVREDPNRDVPRFVIGNPDPDKKNTVSFLEFGSIEAFRSSRVGVLWTFLTDVSSQLAPYLTFSIQPLQEEVRLGERVADPKMKGIRARLREVPIYLENTVGDDASAALTAKLCRQLDRYSGISLQEGTAGAGDALFRIVHNRDFYAACPEQDPHQQAPAHCAVQHLTVEDFQFKGADGTEKKEDAALRKALQEMAVKLDILHGRLTCYDWAALGYDVPVNFVIIPEETKGKDKLTHYRRLQILPDGTLQFCQWQEQPFWEDPEKEKIAAAFRRTNGQLDFDVEGLIYMSADDIQIIRRTERYTLPDMEKLQTLLSSSWDGEMLEVAPILAIARSFLPAVEQKDRKHLEKICSDLAALPPETAGKEIRKCLKLRSSIGRRVNEQIFDQTGMLIGNELKRRKNLEALMGGTLGICLFSQNGAQYYYGGYRAQSLFYSLARACRIRKVTATGGAPHFEKYLPLLEVDFVRASAWTVLPFPFKYLREWRPTYLLQRLHGQGENQPDRHEAVERLQRCDGPAAGASAG